MSVYWLEGTKADFKRIRIFNEDPRYGGSEAKADLYEDDIYNDGDGLSPSDGQPYPRRGSPIRKHSISNGYLLFSRLTVDSDIEIFAVFHSQSGWASLIDDRIDALTE